jgi:hypothetical protein
MDDYRSHCTIIKISDNLLDYCKHSVLNEWHTGYYVSYPLISLVAIDSCNVTLAILLRNREVTGSNLQTCRQISCGFPNFLQRMMVSFLRRVSQAKVK